MPNDDTQKEPAKAEASADDRIEATVNAILAHAEEGLTAQGVRDIIRSAMKGKKK